MDGTAPVGVDQGAMTDLPPVRLNLADPRGEYRLLQEELDDAVARVLASGRYILGPEVEALESECASYLGTTHCVGVSSGTDAIVAALLAMGVGPGDEVVTTAFSFFATAGGILRTGATPVFVDIEEGGFNLDPEHVRKAVTKRTRAVLAVHLFGHTARMEELRDVDVPVLEDAAQAFGAVDGSEKAGTMGLAGCFSFFPAKPLGAVGDAGMVCTDDEELASALRSVRVQGASGKNLHDRPGGNFRMDPLQAAVLRVKLAHLDRWIATRRRYAQLYLQRLASCEKAGHLMLPGVRDGVQSTWAQFVIRTPRRDELRDAMRLRGIASEVYYPLPMPAQEAMGRTRMDPGGFPRTQSACQEVLALPVHPLLDPADVEEVARAIAEFFDEAERPS